MLVTQKEQNKNWPFAPFAEKRRIQQMSTLLNDSQICFCGTGEVVQTHEKRVNQDTKATGKYNMMYVDLMYLLDCPEDRHGAFWYMCWNDVPRGMSQRMCFSVSLKCG